jgi:hypothetical protein
MSTTTSLLNCNFGGIRRKDSSFSDAKITCSDCQNVELFFTGLNSGVGIRTANGNISITTYTDEEGNILNLVPEGETVVGMFTSIQGGQDVFMIHTESSTEGKLYAFDTMSNQLTNIVSGLSVTGNSCGCDFTQGWLDVFIFSNGVEIKYIYTNTETQERLVVESDDNIKLIDTEERPVSGLGLVVFDDRLWVFNGKTLWYSKQAECRDFNFQDPSTVTSAGYIEFVKPITAIYPYLGSLAVFHKDSSVLVSVDAETGFKQDEESPGGCAGYNALVFHGTDLYFYDDTKKGVFSFQQVVNGDKTLGDNIAYDIQDELTQIDTHKLNEIRALSVVTSDRNEAWFLIPIDATYESNGERKEASTVLIFDYIRGEWVKRKCQKIHSMAIYNGSLYSGGEHIYEEYNGLDFNGEFIEAYYTCSNFNLGSDNTLKITKFPPRATLDGMRKCHFWVQYVKNYNALKSVKKKEIQSKTQRSIAYYDKGYTYDSEWIYAINTNTILKFPSSTFKALEIKLYTTNKGQSFALKTLEFSKIKVKQV